MIVAIYYIQKVNKKKTIVKIKRRWFNLSYLTWALRSEESELSRSRGDKQEEFGPTLSL